MDTNDIDALLTTTMIAKFYESFLLEGVIDAAVNGTNDDDSLGFYPDGDIDTDDEDVINRNLVAAAFHMLGQEIAEHAHPLAAYPIIVKLIPMRNAAIKLMREISELNKRRRMTWTYLGDAVYAAFDGYHAVLRVNDPRNTEEPTIYLEPGVVDALFEFLEGLSDDANE